ncbi:hypothetical protein BH11PLA2_BH11PLA2_10750 [soil metagenome]
MNPFRSSCPLSALIAWCRALKHGLGVGLSPVKVFRQQAKSGPAALRDAATRIADRLDTGDSFSDALQPEVGRFPVLFVETVAVGEQAGRLSDVLGELEEHYEAMNAARKQLLVSLTWPAITYFGSIGIITLMILVLGALAPGMDPLGLGYTGIRGAILFLLTASLITFGLIGLTMSVVNDEQKKSRVLGFALSVPGIAACVQAFALQRFSLAFAVMTEAGQRADRSLKVALRATANRKYREAGDTVAKSIRKGNEVYEVLTAMGPTLFPDDFLETVRIGEESGSLAEVMKKQASFYRDEATRKLKIVTMVASGTIYAFIALLVIIAIFRMYASYLKTIDDTMNMIQGGGLLTVN